MGDRRCEIAGCRRKTLGNVVGLPCLLTLRTFCFGVAFTRSAAHYPKDYVHKKCFAAGAGGGPLEVARCLKFLDVCSRVDLL